ncbi:ATP-binding protein [Halopenitus sp. H-Gu1]|uniref:ATP-binding protein n=1 Tax=Halopenitus sp. H-Gu1 TaxID=3242697 RepID=UPI00359D2E82
MTELCPSTVFRHIVVDRHSSPGSIAKQLQKIAREEDDGSGIADTDRENVFDAGFSTEDDGTGFGLSTVKRIVTAHGWEIGITDGSAGGARFTITGVAFVTA